MFVRGGFGRTPPETVGDSRTEFNRVLCNSKSEATVTSNTKLRCRYVEADYKHEESRGLSATAELLVAKVIIKGLTFLGHSV